MNGREEGGAWASRASLRRVIPLRWIVAGAGFVITAAIVLTMGGITEREERRALTRELESRLVLAARNLANASSRALISDFPELTLAPILAEMERAQPEHAFAIVTDQHDAIRGAAEARRLGTTFALPEGVAPRATASSLRTDEQIFGSDELLVAAAPVAHPSGERIGTAYVAFRRDYVDSVIANARRAQVLVVSAALVLGTLVVSSVLAFLLRPLGALREGLERIGRGELQTPIRVRDRTELGLLAATINDMSDRIRVAQQERVERERLAKEVELAHEIQASLLPTGGRLAGAYRIEGSHRAAAEVGGDYYDVFDLPGGRIGLAVADVSGKGLSGCLVTFMLAALLRAYRTEETSPARLLVRLDETLRGSLRPGTFITMFYGILDPAEGSLVFASAGHSPLLVRRAATGVAEWHRTKGIPIGAVRAPVLARTLVEHRLVLAPGDVCVQFTDGVNEAFDPSGERQFGFERLQAAIDATAGKPPAEILARVRADIDRWTAKGPAHDDETLLVLSVAGVAASAPPADPMTLVAESARRGERIRIPADLDELAQLGDWLSQCPGLRTLDPRAATIVESALYEVCANIAEHGYEGQPGRSIDVAWLVDESDVPSVRGHFVLVDTGRPFVPPHTAVDFRDPSVRRRGRGLGLEIVRSAMKQMAYNPGTPSGNVTILSFDPSKLRVEEEVSHG